MRIIARAQRKNDAELPQEMSIDLAFRSKLKGIIVAVWPRLPGLVRRYYWPTRILQLLGLAAPWTPPEPVVVLPAELVATIESYRRGNMESFVAGSLIQLQDRDVAREFLPFLRKLYFGGAVNDSNILQYISEFRTTYLSSPIQNNHGGANYTSGLSLFLIAKHFDPVFVVESGVLRGMSSMIFRKALPRAKILAFDLNFSLLHRSENVEYHQCDWMSVDVTANSSAMAYFDDHVSQARRVVEAHSRGFRHLILDDSWSWGAISGCGGVPLPSIDMLLSDDIKIGDKIEWVEAGQPITYVHDEAMFELCSTARRLIKSASDVPSLYRQTGIAPTSALKFVELA